MTSILDKLEVMWSEYSLCIKKLEKKVSDLEIELEYCKSGKSRKPTGNPDDYLERKYNFLNENISSRSE